MRLAGALGARLWHMPLWIFPLGRTADKLLQSGVGRNQRFDVVGQDRASHKLLL